jgi:hypothetical protein
VEQLRVFEKVLTAAEEVLNSPTSGGVNLVLFVSLLSALLRSLMIPLEHVDLEQVGILLTRAVHGNQGGEVEEFAAMLRQYQPLPIRDLMHNLAAQCDSPELATFGREAAEHAAEFESPDNNDEGRALWIKDIQDLRDRWERAVASLDNPNLRIMYLNHEGSA